MVCIKWMCLLWTWTLIYFWFNDSKVFFLISIPLAPARAFRLKNQLFLFISLLKIWDLKTVSNKGKHNNRSAPCLCMADFKLICVVRPRGWKSIELNPSCEAYPLALEMWPFKRGGISSAVEINTFMFRFTLASGLSRGGGLLSGWPLKRGSTVWVFPIHMG